jgi:hypothetical protein
MSALFPTRWVDYARKKQAYKLLKMVGVVLKNIRKDDAHALLVSGIKYSSLGAVPIILVGACVFFFNEQLYDHRQEVPHDLHTNNYWS